MIPTFSSSPTLPAPAARRSTSAVAEIFDRYLKSDVEDCAAAIASLLLSRTRLVRPEHEQVRRNFLLPRLAWDELTLIKRRCKGTTFVTLGSGKVKPAGVVPVSDTATGISKSLCHDNIGAVAAEITFSDLYEIESAA